MTDFATTYSHLGSSSHLCRSTEQAAAFMREHRLQHMDHHAAEVLVRLEDVRSAEEAQEAAQAFRTWIASGLLARADEGHRVKYVQQTPFDAESPELPVDQGSAAVTWR